MAGELLFVDGLGIEQRAEVTAGVQPEGPRGQEASQMCQKPASRISLTEASKLIDHLKQLQDGQDTR